MAKALSRGRDLRASLLLTEKRSLVEGGGADAADDGAAEAGPAEGSALVHGAVVGGVGAAALN